MPVRSTTRRKIYKFVHHMDISIQTSLLGRSFKNDWIEISETGLITCTCSNPSERGYAWDGCSPKRNFLDITWGTPDGKLDFETEKPITYYASLFHDVLYQFKREVPVTRLESDDLFKEMLKLDRFSLWLLYYIGVRIGGAFYGKWRSRNKSQRVLASTRSWRNP